MEHEALAYNNVVQDINKTLHEQLLPPYNVSFGVFSSSP